MNKADADDSTPLDAGGKAEPNAGSDAEPEPAAPRPMPAYITATEAITLLAFGKATTLAALNAEREAFVAAEMEAQAARETTLETGEKVHPDQLREKWAKRDGRGADMAAAVALLLHELRSGKPKVRGTLDGDPEGLVRVVPLEFLLLPVTINNDAFEADPAPSISMRDFTKARQLPVGGTRPMYRDLLFEAADVLKLCRRKRPKAPSHSVPDATLDEWLFNYLSVELARLGRPAKREPSITALMEATGCTQEAARLARRRAPKHLKNPANRPGKPGEE